ncbi:hopanoid biosynthesis-associated protein HpnK [Geobacter sp. AOG2]|uniref:hopanoid biosynthesis-associated protein HpnK n=1 Tax=Geobacter sp. AOG2 TaxID=1566347 RepID=UPI001CC4C3ED|nr:hopanoid biosynthesis-associated protein HpnK [Geobacter sp. AOG2]GFE60211.1 hydrolase [Geobacter sp. AOG2]
MKQLIITSDDFGLSPGVNAAVEKAWRDGILTCASIMPGAAAFDEAVGIARRNPDLQVGLHLTLVQGSAVLPPEDIPGLVDAAGNFRDNPVAAGMRYFFDKGLYKPLQREIEAQIKRVKDAGIPVTHIDGHLNIHLHPTVFSILGELMPRYGIASFRLSRERLLHNLTFNRERVAGKTLERLIFGALSSHACSGLQRMGIRHACEVKGVLNSGRMNEEYILNILDGLNEGLTEIYFHPGCLPDSEITRRMPDYRHEDELAAITSPQVRRKLAALAIELTNYRGDVKQYV